MISNNMQAAQQSLETVNSRITLAESELARLNKLVASENYTVSELVKQKKFEEEELARLREDVSKLEKLKSSISTDLSDAQNKISQASAIEKEANAKLLFADRRVNEIADKEKLSNEKLKEYETALSLEKSELEAASKALSSKENIILDFSKYVAELCSKLEYKG